MDVCSRKDASASRSPKHALGHVARSASFKLALLWNLSLERTEQRPPRTGCFARLQACSGQNPDGSPLSPHEAGQIACDTRSQAVSILN